MIGPPQQRHDHGGRWLAAEPPRWCQLGRYPPLAPSKRSPRGDVVSFGAASACPPLWERSSPDVEVVKHRRSFCERGQLLGYSLISRSASLRIARATRPQVGDRRLTSPAMTFHSHPSV